MDRSKWAATTVAIGAFLPLVYEWRIGAPLDVLIDLSYAYIALAGGVWAWALRPEIGRLLRRSEEPNLRVRPLEHRHGWMVPSGASDDWERYLGDDPRIGPKPSWGRPTHPERVGHGIHPSQVLELVWLDPVLHPNNKAKTEQSGETAKVRVDLRYQAAKFGVLSITNSGGEAEHCSAHGYYRLGGDSREHDMGLLNWYSFARWNALKRNAKRLDELAQSTAHTFNADLETHYLDIPRNASEKDECDVCLFYMITEPQNPYVYMAASGWNPIPAKATRGNPLRLRIRVRFKARGMEPFDRNYRATISPDDYTIEEAKDQ